VVIAPSRRPDPDVTHSAPSAVALWLYCLRQMFRQTGLSTTLRHDHKPQASRPTGRQSHSAFDQRNHPGNLGWTADAPTSVGLRH
jgi:hypothetical protein